MTPRNEDEEHNEENAVQQDEDHPDERHPDGGNQEAITTMVVVPMLKCNQTVQLILIVETNT